MGNRMKLKIVTGSLFFVAIVVKSIAIGGGALTVALSVSIIVGIVGMVVLVEHHRNR